ncbi:MAG: multiheme c-type cytochrome [Rhodothermales bacterium]
MRRTRGKSLESEHVPKRRFLFIGVCIVLMAATVYVVGEGISEGLYEAPEARPLAEAASPSALASEVSGFSKQHQALAYLETSDTHTAPRRLAAFYARRAYPGAPPIIPHLIENDRNDGDACLTCHADGGYVPRFDAYTPVTPHPTLVNCRQCHVRAKADDLFKSTDWQRMPPPSLNGSVLPDSPPPVPHSLQMRENCLACHAGPGAVEDLRVSHPERINCRQCHALMQTSSVWVRPETTPSNE